MIISDCADHTCLKNRNGFCFNNGRCKYVERKRDYVKRKKRKK